METGYGRAAGRQVRRYRIGVRGELTQTFLALREQVFVESTGEEWILAGEVVDHPKLEARFSWLYARAVEIVRSSGTRSQGGARLTRRSTRGTVAAQSNRSRAPSGRR